MSTPKASSAARNKFSLSPSRPRETHRHVPLKHVNDDGDSGGHSQKDIDANDAGDCGGDANDDDDDALANGDDDAGARGRHPGLRT